VEAFLRCRLTILSARSGARRGLDGPATADSSILVLYLSIKPNSWTRVEATEWIISALLMVTKVE
jgi:hypothetical protein